MEAFLAEHALPIGVQVEYKHATVCRRELLIEIEGIAVIDDDGKVVPPQPEQPKAR